MSKVPPIRVVLVDDHVHIHEAVALVLQAAADIDLIGHGSNGSEALQLCESLKPDLVLLDVLMPQMNGIETAHALRQRFPAIKVLALSSLQDEDTARLMMRAGIVGYILKSSLNADLISAIRAVVSGSIVLASEIAAELFNPTAPAPSADFRLTERELEILKQMAAGLSNGEIAAVLTISVSTVKFHVANILNKLHVETRAEAVVLAVRNALA